MTSSREATKSSPFKASSDIHKIRYFTSVITVSRGKVMRVTPPAISSCPLASRLYKKFRSPELLSKAGLRSALKDVVEDKIRRFGFFTARRELAHDGPAIPFGASEIIAHALKSRFIDSAVMVCDGAGTIVVPDGPTAQGVGARMHTVLKTSPIPAVIRKLKGLGSDVVFNDGTIDQAAGVARAAEQGHQKIAVTVSAYGGESLAAIRAVERSCKADVAILVICTTGARAKRIREIEKYADIAWSCHSDTVRERLEKIAAKRLSAISPVYLLTKKGVELTNGYAPNIYKIRKEIGRP